MTFLAPLFFYIGLGVAAGAVALHFIVTRQPPSSPMPTARFVPEGSVLVTTVAKPTDLTLLALRVLLALVIGAAFARPIVTRTPRPLARIVLADVSQAVGSIDAVRDSARGLLGEGDVLVVFDSTARAIERGARDSAFTFARSDRQGRLSAALITALRAASKLRATADSFELAIVSPFRAVEFDGATAALRRLWPGRIRLVSVPASADSAAPAPAPAGVAVHAGDPDDPVALAVALSGAGRTGAQADTPVRIVRQPASAAERLTDSAWAAGPRHTLVRWPAEKVLAGAAPSGWIARAKVDTVGAVVAGQAALVVPLERRWRLDPAARPARIVARWVDGEPAAVDYMAGGGCIRDVTIPVGTRGDVMLRPAFARLLETLVRSCALRVVGPAAAERVLATVAGTGSLAARAAIPTSETVSTPLVPWLLGLAIALALAEIAVRRRSVA